MNVYRGWSVGGREVGGLECQLLKACLPIVMSMQQQQQEKYTCNLVSLSRAF